MLISEFTKSFSNIPRETAASVLEEKKKLYYKHSCKALL